VCGIAGVHIKDRALEPDLGQMLVPIIESLATRGPDSAGIALYDRAQPPGLLRWSLRTNDDQQDWDALGTDLGRALDVDVAVEAQQNMALLTCAATETATRQALHELAPAVDLVGFGHAIRIYKDVGAPAEICDRYGLRDAGGFQGVGHTRMATESAVTTRHSHPFSTSADLALVHNGSFSNYASIRRKLQDNGVAFDTDNDSEVAARYISDRIARGDTLEDAIRMVLKDFDGFFTLLVASQEQFVVVRDAFACKPLVVAETATYVAVASEYHALSKLPGIESAIVFEPQPEEVHVWTRS
jgi:methylamine---glutamate N-methyltransferase subunit A